MKMKYLDTWQVALCSVNTHMWEYVQVHIYVRSLYSQGHVYSFFDHRISKHFHKLHEIERKLLECSSEFKVSLFEDKSCSWHCIVEYKGVNFTLFEGSSCTKSI